MPTSSMFRHTAVHSPRAHEQNYNSLQYSNEKKECSLGYTIIGRGNSLNKCHGKQKLHIDTVVAWPMDCKLV